MEARFVTANGLRFGYLESGTGPLVLLVHGFPDTAHTWDRVRPALAEAGFRAVAMFTRGYFPTAIPEDGKYDADTLGRDVLAMIEALGEQSAILVGHDFGAGAVYSSAAIDPARVRRLITVAIPHPASVIPTPKLLWTVRHFFRFQLRSSEALLRANDFAHIDELVKRWSPAWTVPAGETDAVKESFRVPGALEAALGYYRALRLVLPPAQRKRISVDTVSFAGENDTISPTLYDRARSRFTGPYKVVRMPGGHFMHREHPEHFIRELLTAVREAPTTPLVPSGT
jgi:pimeloyl-ACP methyl ester carboxylesterase